MSILAHETEQPAIGGDSRRPQVRRVDFSLPTAIARGHQLRLERAHEAFCRGASARLSLELRAPLSLELAGSEQLAWDAALAGLPGPSVHAVVAAAPAGSEVVLAAELTLVMRLFDRLLGGSGTRSLERAEPTDIELAVTRRLFTTIVDQLSPVWQDLLGLTLSLRRLETQAEGLGVARASEPCLKLRLLLRDAGGEGALALLVPRRSIEAALPRLRADEPAAPVEQAPAEAEVALRAEVARLDLKLSELLALEEGSLVQLGVSPEAGVTLYAGSLPVRRALAGRRGNRRAVEVVEVVERPEAAR